MLSIKSLPADHGESTLISFGEVGMIKNILVDGGVGNAYLTIREELERLINLGQAIDLLVITHIDDDHIQGIIDIFQDESIDKAIIKEVWFNSGNSISTYFKTGDRPEREVRIVPGDTTLISVAQGRTLEKELLKYGSWNKEVITVNQSPIDFEGCKITILSPDRAGLEKLNKIWPPSEEETTFLSAAQKDYNLPISTLLINTFNEDRSIRNASSIAFLFEFNSKQILMLADSLPSVVEHSLRVLKYSEDNKLKVDLTKVSHHGSKKNTSPTLLSIMECKNYIISTDGTRHGLPNKECLSRIIKSQPGVNLYFNYPLKHIFLEEDVKEYEFNCHYLCDNLSDYCVYLEEN